VGFDLAKTTRAHGVEGSEVIGDEKNPEGR
jgi:hypothetical protein